MELIVNTEKEDELNEAIKRGEKVDLIALAKIPKYLVEIEMEDKKKKTVVDDKEVEKNRKLVEWM